MDEPGFSRSVTRTGPAPGSRRTRSVFLAQFGVCGLVLVHVMCNSEAWFITKLLVKISSKQTSG